MKETWKDEYCKKFGLCENQPKYSKCTCSKELKFISKEIESTIKAERERIVGEIEKLRINPENGKVIPVPDINQAVGYIDGFNTALKDSINLINK